MLPSEEFCFALADAAAVESLSRFRRPMPVDNKYASGFDPVTEADRAVERAIRSRISEVFPDHAIRGEEFGVSAGDGFEWVIDPIDGTRAFISGVPVWGTLIGLKVDGVARLGLMDQPFTGERFWAAGDGAWLCRRAERTRLETRGGIDLRAATLYTTSPRIFEGGTRAAFERLEARARLTRFSCDCYAFAMLAAGQVDLVVETGLQPHDIVALIPIVEGAGGIITNFAGGRAEEGGDIVAAGSRALHAEAMAVLAG